MHTLVLSDIHLGNGHGFDIFSGAALLPATLAEAAAQRAHVVLNGDSFDFLMNEDPLELVPARAVAQAQAIAESADGGAALRGPRGGAGGRRLGRDPARQP
jgi:hypothetical protein